MGRFLAGLVIALLLQPLPALATTANDLSGRIVIDGLLNDYTNDEWVLDDSTDVVETGGDSRWGSDNDITRVALTWDHNFLYIGVAARTFDSLLELFIFNRAGGLATLEETGQFRRAIELPFPVNLIALAQPGRIPDVARADDSHAFGVVDRGAVPVAINGTRTGPVGFEMAVPWSMLSIAQPVKLVAAVTGELGTGAGDCAPNLVVAMDSDRFARAVLDHWFEVNADTDDDGVADIGRSPRDIGSVKGPFYPTNEERKDAGVRLSVPKRAFAPDRGDEVDVDIIQTGLYVYVSVAVYSLEGEHIRTLFENAPIINRTTVSWNGRNAHGDIVRGGTYIVVADWGYNQGEHNGRAKTAVVVAR